MSKLDEALINLRQNMNDAKKQSAFYDLFLNSSFFVPVLPGSQEGGAETDGSKEVLPLITEAEGKDYLMLFSSLERLKGWLPEGEEVPHVEVAGHLLALSSAEPLHWALDVGTEFSKQFFPEEIAWLREAVERCNADAAKKQEGCCG